MRRAEIGHEVCRRNRRAQHQGSKEPGALVDIPAREVELSPGRCGAARAVERQQHPDILALVDQQRADRAGAPRLAIGAEGLEQPVPEPRRALWEAATQHGLRAPQRA